MTRRRDLLQTLVWVCIGLTPAWLAPQWFAVPWLVMGVIFGVPALYYSWRYAPWVPTPAQELSRILGLLELQPGDAFCDLGAGDGRMVLRVNAATGARCVGIEGSPLQYLIARIRLAVAGNSGTNMVFGDVHACGLTEFDVLYVWGTAYWVGTPAFREHVVDSLRPGSRLVSYHYPVLGREPDRVDRGGERPIYVYYGATVKTGTDRGGVRNVARALRHRSRCVAPERKAN